MKFNGTKCKLKCPIDAIASITACLNPTATLLYYSYNHSLKHPAVTWIGRKTVSNQLSAKMYDTVHVINPPMHF